MACMDHHGSHQTSLFQAMKCACESAGSIGISTILSAFFAGVVWGLGLYEFLLGETKRWRRERLRKGENEGRRERMSGEFISY